MAGVKGPAFEHCAPSQNLLNMLYLHPIDQSPSLSLSTVLHLQYKHPRMGFPFMVDKRNLEAAGAVHSCLGQTALEAMTQFARHALMRTGQKGPQAASVLYSRPEYSHGISLQWGRRTLTGMDRSALRAWVRQLELSLPVMHVFGPIVDAVAVCPLERYDDTIDQSGVACVAKQIPALIVDRPPHLHTSHFPITPA